MNEIVSYFWNRLFFCKKVDLRAPTTLAEIVENSSKKPNFSFSSTLEDGVTLSGL